MERLQLHLTLKKSLAKRIQRLLVIFISGLILSGVTAFPLEAELDFANEVMSLFLKDSLLGEWVKRVYSGVQTTNEHYPFIAYGTNWLGFAHLIIAVLFVGPLRDPVKNVWVVEFGMIACIAIFPFAFIAGTVREIPLFWRLFDCLFGFAGGLILLFCYRDISKLKKLTIS